MITCDELISVMGIILSKIANTRATNVSINCHNKKVRHKIHCYIFHTISLAMVLLLIMVIICYH